MYTNSGESTLEDLIAEAFRRLRLFVAAARAASLGRQAKEHAFAVRCLRDLEQDQILDRRIEGALDALRGILGDELGVETHGVRRVFHGFHDPEAGDIGRVREIPIRSDRGEQLADVLALFDALVESREIALDRLRAEREMRRAI